MDRARPMRADAVRNRARILSAAREQITLLGPDAPMDAIAEAAGVAVGTLYRHFPTKTDLVGAVIAEHTARMAADVEAAADRVDGGAGALAEITALVHRVVESAAADRAVKAAARELGATGGARPYEERGGTAMGRLIAAARANGDLHPDVTVEDFLLLLATAPTDQGPAVRRRWLELFLPGLTVRGRPTA
ncbi:MULTISPECIES: helix-turn-helix domain-containing protein [unclassified Streptomyces]|uniref:TetR/AcrR family transcriptional regulator n=1 Tax=unclassified Streptomyces TaxID=2593676 RepID=UPI00340B605E